MKQNELDPNEEKPKAPFSDRERPEGDDDGQLLRPRRRRIIRPRKRISLNPDKQQENFYKEEEGNPYDNNKDKDSNYDSNSNYPYEKEGKDKPTYDREDRGSSYNRPSYNNDRRDQSNYYDRDNSRNYNRGGGGGYDRNDRGGYNRNDRYDNRGGGGGYNRNNRYDNNRGGGYDRNDRGGYNRNNRYDNNRGGGYDRNDRGGYNRNNRYDNNRGGGGGGYNRNDRYDNRGSGGGGYNRNNRYDNRGGGGGGYNRNDRYDNRGGGGGYGRNNRYDNRGGGGGYGRNNRYDNRGGGGGYGRNNRYDNRGGGGGYGRDRRNNKFNYHALPPQTRPEVEPGVPAPDMPEEMRLNKYIAHAGLCSRRKADEYIQGGRVKVNGEVITILGSRVKRGDEVLFDDKPLNLQQKHVYILLNKPKNVITTVKDEKGRQTVVEIASQITKERVYPVGRLDRNTTGLLMLTNDGELAQKLAHPSYEIKKVYHVVLDKPLAQEDMEAIRNTIELKDGPVPVDAVDYVRNKPMDNVGIELHVGRNRIVRRIFEHLGYRVIKLDRTLYGPLNKKSLPRGRCRFLDESEIIMLKNLTC